MGNELYIWDFYRGHLKVLNSNGQCKEINYSMHIGKDEDWR